MLNKKSHFINRLKITTKNFKNDCRFSFRLAMYRLFETIFGYVGNRKVCTWAFNKRSEVISGYLEKEVQTTLDKYKREKLNESTPKGRENIIWTGWLQGREEAPSLVKVCINSIYENNKNSKIVFISFDNIKEYLEIPEYILERLKKKKMTYAHFKDYVVICLLEKYGGIWFDAGIYMSKSIPQWVTESDFFTCKSEPQHIYNISYCRWSTYCMGGVKGSIIFSFLREVLEEYWKRNVYCIDYNFLDYMIYIGDKDVPIIHEILDKVPLNNSNRDALRTIWSMNRPISEINNFIQDNTFLYKLDYHNVYRYKVVTDAGEDTIYSYFKNKEG